MISRVRKAKISWQCRRGMLELDLMLASFLKNAVDGLTEEELLLFESLLHTSDPLLYAWLMGSAEPERKEFIPLVECIQRQHQIVPV